MSIDTWTKIGGIKPFSYMGYFLDLWNNQPSIFIGAGLAILVLLGIYIKLLDIYQ